MLERIRIFFLFVVGVALPLFVIKSHPNITLINPAVSPFHLMIDVRPLGIWLLLAVLSITIGALIGITSRSYALVFRALMLFIAIVEGLALLSWPHFWGWLQLYPPVLGLLIETIIIHRRYPMAKRVNKSLGYSENM